MAGLPIDTLREQVRGRVITSADAEYNEARAVYNSMIDRKPAAVVQVAGVADVIACVNFARENKIDLAIRGGGHSGPGFGTCDGGLVIDFVNRKGIRVDPDTKTVRAEGGVTWADFNHATYAFGLATTGGILGTTGIAGLTLGGGIGYLSRRCGLTLDNLISTDVVLADGTFVTASPDQNQDLFWALRGGGGNFGVVTSLEYKLHPIADVTAGIVVYGAEHGEKVARFYKEFINEAPEEFGAFFGFHQGPPVPFVPEEWHGKPVCVIVGMWTGDQSEGEKRWKPILDAAPVVGSMVAKLPYPFLNGAFDELLPPGGLNYWKSSFLKDISDGVIEANTKFGPNVPTLQSGMHCYPINGAVHRVGKDETAFAYRDVNFSPIMLAYFTDPKQKDSVIGWVRDYWEAYQPYCTPGGYINFMDADDQGRITDNYRDLYKKLATVKKKYDSGNLFHLNQNIKPA